MMMSDGNAAAPGGSPPPEKLLTVVIPHYNQRDFLPRAVASVLRGEPCDLDRISEASGLSPARLLPRLFDLELRGLVGRAGGGRFVRFDRPC